MVKKLTLVLLLIIGSCGLAFGKQTELGSFATDKGIKTYYHFTDPQSWNDARAICREVNMDLVQVDSKAEESHLFNLVLPTLLAMPDQQIHKWLHVGGIRVGDGWMWRNDFSNLYSGLKWAPGEPNNWASIQYCMCMGKEPNVNYVAFADLGCSNEKFGFLCQQFVRN